MLYKQAQGKVKAGKIIVIYLNEFPCIWPDEMSLESCIKEALCSNKFIYAGCIF